MGLSPNKSHVVLRIFAALPSGMLRCSMNLIIGMIGRLSTKFCAVHKNQLTDLNQPVGRVPE
jgi:hypothetical protein